MISSIRARPQSMWSRMRYLRPGAEVAAAYAVLAALGVLGALKSPLFLSGANLSNVGLQAVTLSLLAIGQTFVLLGGGVDMSVGSTVTLTSLIGAILMNGRDGSMLYVLPLLLALGVAIGFANGLLVNLLRVEPFIVTFGTFFILEGLGSLISLQPVGQTPPAMLNLYVATWGGVPVPVVLIALVWCAAGLLLRRSRFGWRVLAVGGRAEVAQLSGIPVARVRLATYALSGATAALAGMFTLVVQGLGNPTAGTNLEFLSITAAAVGGVSLAGGRGTLVGALGGVLILTTIGNLLQLLHVNTFYEQPLQGVVILVAVATRLRRPAILTRRAMLMKTTERGVL